MAPKKKAAKSGKPGPAKKAKSISENATAVAHDMNTAAESKSDLAKSSNPESVALNVPGTMTVYSSRLHLMTLPPDVFLCVLDFLVGSYDRGFAPEWGYSLKNFSGLAEVSKAFSRVWELLPRARIKIAAHSVNSDAAARVMCNLGVSLQKLDLTVRYNSASEDFALFARTVRGSAKQPFVDIFPKLRLLRLEPTFEKVTLTSKELISFVNIDARKTNMRYGGCFDPDIFGEDLDDSDLWMLPGPSTPCNLDALGTVPPRLTIQCDQIRPSGIFRSIKCINFRQFGDDTVVKNFKKTRLQALTTESIALEGCMAGNLFTNKMLEYMPPTLKMLRMACSPQFNMPCDFPAHLTLTKLVLEHVHFVHPKIGRLPSSLNELVLDISGNCWAEDDVTYDFPTFDITGLPPSLTTLTIVGGDYYDKITCQVIGTWPPGIKTVKLYSINIDSSLANALPAGATLQTLTDSPKEVDDDAGWVFLSDGV